jgi:uncharacterized GH25 family protein
MKPRRSAIRDRVALLSIVTALSGVPVVAHDMWIEPATFSPQSGDIVAIRLRVGQDLLGDPIPRDPSLINQFIVEDATGRRPVVGRDGGDPAGFVLASAPGLVVGYSSNPSAVELPAEKFNQYLKEEGLDAVAAARARRNETTRGAREIFSRCAKSLIASGDRRLGFTLELVAERNPFTLHPGDELPLTLTYQNRPLTGALVIAFNRAHPSEKLRVRTDGDGRVRLRLSESGLWLVKAVHMIPAPAGTQAEWASYWASLTFELPGTADSSRGGGASAPPSR